MFLLVLTLFTFKATFAQTYCTPSYTFNCTSDDDINSFTLNGYSQSISTLNTSCPTSGTNNYSPYLSDTADGYQGQTYGGYVTTEYSSSEYICIWIDFNDDGTFATSELMFTSPTSFGSSSAQNYSFTLPNTAAPGAHRMRVRLAYYEAPTDPCSNYNYGETHDYVFKVIALPNCSGAPNAGTIANMNICPNIGYTLNAVGTTIASGITQQWQTSTTGQPGSWTNIAGANSNTYTEASGLATSQYYRHYSVCSLSSLTDTSASALVSVVGGPQCVCIPTIDYNWSEYGITNVKTMGGIQNINNTTGQGTYTSYVSSDTVSGVVGMSINYSITATDNYTRYAIYVDWNQNGSFNDPGDTVYYMQPSYSNAGTNVFTGIINIPTNATTGHTRMRIRTTYYYPATWSNYNSGPCGSSSEGEVEDYDFYVIPQTPCSGQPNGLLTLSDTAICPDNSIGLSILGNNVYNSGITYQWQVADSGSSTWTTLATTQAPVYNPTTLYATPKKFRCIMTCASSPNTPYTTNTDYLHINGFYNCYCTPTTSASYSYYISNVTTTGGIQQINNSSTYFSSGYADYTNEDTASGYVGQQINYSITNSSDYAKSAIYIDWNHNGNFNDPGDTVYYGIADVTPTNSTLTGSFIIPASAISGHTRMRVRSNAYYSGSDYNVNPCDAGYYGETEDYDFYVVPQTACSGTPYGTAVASNIYVCPNETFSLNLNNYPYSNSGITYQWQVTDSGTNNWANVSNGSNIPYLTINTIPNTKQYRCVLNCANSTNTYTTNVVTIHVNDFYNCFCTPTVSYNWGEYGITNVTTTNGLLNFNNTTTQSTYSNYSTSDTAGGVRGMSVNYSLNLTDNYSRYAIYIDWNHNASFNDPGDTVYYMPATYSSPGTSTFTGVINIPNNAPLGHTIMRVRSTYYYPSTWSNYNNGPCGDTYEGETEDYDFYVMPCPITDTIHSSFASICPGGSVTLNATTNTDTASFTWNTGATGNSITVNAAGTYIATATSALCAVSDTFVLNQGVQDSLYITPDSPTICGGYPAIIKAHSSHPNAQFTWNTGEATDSLIVGTAATYTVTTTIAGQAGCGNEASIEVTSSPSPFAEIILVTNAGTGNPLEVHIHALNVTNTNTYVWNLGDNVIITNTDSVMNYIYNQPGHYTISLAIVNECDTSFLTKDFDLDMSTGVNDIDITNQDVNLYPNPATEEVNIVNKLDNSKMKHITIFNALGQVIYSKDANSANRHQLNINSFASGIYSVRIDLDKGVAIRKLQITK